MCKNDTSLGHQPCQLILHVHDQQDFEVLWESARVLMQLLWLARVLALAVSRWP